MVFSALILKHHMVGAGGLVVNGIVFAKSKSISFECSYSLEDKEVEANFNVEAEVVEFNGNIFFNFVVLIIQNLTFSVTW